MAKPKRRTRGVLTKLVKYPKSSDKHYPLWRKALNLGGAIVLLALLVVLFIGALNGMFNPKAGERAGEGNFKIETLQENPPGFPASDDTVALAKVRIEGYAVPIPVPAARREGLEVGAILHVKYRVHPIMRNVVVDAWRLGGAPQTPDSGTAGRPGDTP